MNKLELQITESRIWSINDWGGRTLKKQKKTKPYAQRLIPVVVLAIMLYTIADILLQIFIGTEISTTLTTCYFAFWGVEIVNLALIKFGKAKVKQPSEFGELDTEQLNQVESEEG